MRDYMSIGLLVAFIISWLSVAVLSYLIGYRHGKHDGRYDMMLEIFENKGEIIEIKTEGFRNKEE